MSERTEGEGTNDRVPAGAPEKLTHDDYTVGWIGVLRCELTAATILLDENHEPLPTVVSDSNVYRLGRMGQHNVVIASPSRSGVANAAKTATNMIRTFRNIKIGLLVGLGGGLQRLRILRIHRTIFDLEMWWLASLMRTTAIPITLLRYCGPRINFGLTGEADTYKISGGVLQYDKDHSSDRGVFTIKSHLNKPPEILLKAIKLLGTDHDTGPGEWLKCLDEGMKKSQDSPLRKTDFRFPGREQDMLFKAEYLHVGGNNCGNCDKEQFEPRAPRNKPVYFNRKMSWKF